MDFSIPTIISIFFGVVFSVIGYLLMQRDKDRNREISALQTQCLAITKNAADEKEKSATLVLSENRKNTEMLLAERDKLSLQFKTDYKELDEKMVALRIMIAQDYATTKLVEKILNQITTPLTKKLDEIESLLSTKLDRHEFERHEKMSQQ